MSSIGASVGSREESDAPDVLERVRGEAFEKFRLSLETERAQAESTSPGRGVGRPQRAEVVGTSNGVPSSDQSGDGHDHTFIERLYRNANSYADRLTPEDLESIHVDLGVDDYLLTQAQSGRQIVVTGNPGDGKTHLIERLRPQLEAQRARVITDANALSDAEVLRQWTQSHDDGRPFVLAINEWPLYVLRRHDSAEGFAPVGEAIRQVTSARFFVEAQQPPNAMENVAVVDLSLRNLLSGEVIERVIDRLTQERFFVGLNQSDPAIKNREALRDPQVQRRLVGLLELVSTRASHVTMRQTRRVHRIPHHRWAVCRGQSSCWSGCARVHILQPGFRRWGRRIVRSNSIGS